MTCHTFDPSAALQAAEREHAAIQAENIELKETNQRLNRRCQQAEAGVEENVEACRREGVSLGRALAWAEVGRVEAEIIRLRKIVDEADQLVWQGTPGSAWIQWSRVAREALEKPRA